MSNGVSQNGSRPAPQELARRGCARSRPTGATAFIACSWGGLALILMRTHMKTSALEHLRLERDRADFLMDGRAISIHGDARSPALTALRELHEHALADYEFHRANRAQRNGILARMGSWLGRFWGNRAHLESEGVGPPSPHVVPAHSLPASAATFARTPRAFAAPSPATVQIERIRGDAAQLRSIFADEKGVHVVWQETRPDSENIPTSSQEQTHLTYALDSDFARHLHRCFEELSVLGYKVIGAELLVDSSSTATPKAKPIESTRVAHRAGARDMARENAASPQPAGFQSNTDVQSASAIKEVAGAKTSSRDSPYTLPESAPATPHEIVMRLHPPSAEHPSRALVSPAGANEKPEVLIAPERVLRALHAAADSSRPLAERMTYLRCCRGEKGLRIVAVGFGEGDQRTPNRWEDAKKWWTDTGQTLAAKNPSANAPDCDAVADKLGPTFLPGSEPLRHERPLKPQPQTAGRISDSLTPEPS